MNSLCKCRSCVRFVHNTCVMHQFLRRRRFTPSAVQGRSGNVETVNFENNKGRMGESLGEVANESFESSEL